MSAVVAGLGLAAAAQAGPAIRRFDGTPIDADRIDREAKRMMAEAHVNGLAMAVIEDGRVAFVRTWGRRSVEPSLPLGPDTVMYGASLTKLVFAYMALQLVDEGRLDLDRPIAALLPKPLPEYPYYAAIKDDERWRKLTPRLLLAHASGLANFAFLEPDGKMRFHFDPGTRYAYSGEGILLLQFALETGLGLDVGREMQRRVFDRFGMTRTSMTWRDDFAADVVEGYAIDGSPQPHGRRRNVRAAGSMDTTIHDMAQFVAGLVRGDGLSPRVRAEMVKPQLAIAGATQFPTFTEETSPAWKAIELSAGLGLVTFEGPLGHAFFKGGHDDSTANTAFCVDASRRCAVFLSNDVRAESVFQRLTETTLGDPGMPWAWESYVPYDRPASPAP